jgi:hypothetical protein
MHSFLKLLPQKGRAVTFLSVLCLLITANAFATDYYVALPPLGNNTTNNGQSAQTPFATIQKAADVAGPGDVVYVLPGTYREQVEIKSNGVTFQPRDGKGTVTLNGADLMLNWTVASGSTYKTTMNWNVESRWGTNQVFQDGRMIELLRWPKQTSSDIVMPTNGRVDTAYAGSEANTVVIVDSRFNEPAARWVGAKIWINLASKGFDGQGRTGRVVAINGNAITVIGGDGKAIGRLGAGTWGISGGTEYFLFDPAPAALATDADVNAALAPGEWWKNGNNLYVKTRSGGAPASAATATSNVIEAKRRHFAFWPQLPPTGSVANYSGYTIKNFNLFACSISTDRSFLTNRVVEAANNITLSGLTVKYVSHQTVMQGDAQGEHYGWTGIVLSGRNNTLEDSDIMYAATSAVSVIGASNKVLRNRIHETNYIASNSGAVNTGFMCVDPEIGYNQIWNTTMMGINIRAIENSNPEVKHRARIHHNTIYDFMLRSHDSAAIDVFGQDMKWARIDHNTIYNTRPEARIGGRKYGIYLDYGGGANGLNRIRATVDHNVVWDVNNPMTLNSGWDVHIFNNVFLAPTRDVVDEGSNGPGTGVTGLDPEGSKGLSINLRLNDAPKAGTNVLVFNNITSEAITGGKAEYGYAPIETVEGVLNNITNATGAVLAQLFVDATSAMVPGTPSTRNYRLKSTATAAIDKGVSVEEYTANYPLDRPVVGLTDIGAFEHPTSSIGADTQAPSVPQSTTFVVADTTGNSFRVSWTASTDNVGVAYYEVYSNGVLVKKTNETSVVLTGLEGSTTYFIKVLAVDASGNRSALSTALAVKTLSPVVDLSIPKTTTAPVIDGTKDAAWTLPMLPITKLPDGTAPTNAADFSGEWTTMWDDSNLYLFIDVNDNQKVTDSPTNEWYKDDHIEIIIDADGSRTSGPKQHQYYMLRGGPFYKWVWPSGREVPGAQASMVEKANNTGYRVEIKIPFSAMGVKAEALALMGIDVQIGDDDDGGEEDTRLSWATNLAGAHANPTLLGVAKLTAPGIPNDTENPSAPTGLTASNIRSTELTINWNASTDNGSIQNYEVFVNGNLVGTPKLTSFTLKDLTEGTAYSVQVRAKDRFDNLSGLSSILRVTTPTRATATIYQTEEVATLAGGATKILSNAPGVFPQVLSGYTGTGYGKMSHDGNSSISFTVTVAKAGTYEAFYRFTADENTRFSFFVNGVKMGGNYQDYGTIVGAQRLLIGNNGSLDRWDDVPLMLTLNAGANTVELRSVGNSDNRGIVYLDYLAVYPLVDSQGPGMPTNLNVSNTTATGFTLTWTASTDNTGVAPSYQVYRGSTLVGTTTGTTFNVTSLAAGTYTMTVRAVDAAGSQSDASESIEVAVTGGGAVGIGNNPGFENNFTSWFTYGTASVNTNTAHVRSGTKSGYFTNGGGNYVVTGLTPGATYSVKAWVKAVTGTNIWVVVTGYGAPQVGAQMTSTSWTQSGDIVFTMGANNTSATLAAWTGNGSAAYFDDFTITRIIPVNSLKVTPAIAAVESGGTQQLTTATSPVNATIQTVTWSSSNPAVATVSNTGLVTGVSTGTAIITATGTSSGKTATATVTVDPTVVRGEVVQEIWSVWSDDLSVASIPVNRTPRTVQVLNTLEDPTESTGGIEGFGQRIRGYIIPSTTATYYFYVAADETGYFYLSSDYSPANRGIDPIAFTGRTGTREWQNGAQAATQKSVGKALIAGKKYYFEAYMREKFGLNNLAIGWTTAVNNTGITVIGGQNIGRYNEGACTTCRSSAEVESQLPTEGFTLRLHPNPANQQVSIDLSGFAGESSVQVKMSDMSGKLFLGQQVQLSEGVNKVTLPVSHLPQGLFFVSVQGSKTSRTAKLVITK